jgi:hypothetical protein
MDRAVSRASALKSAAPTVTRPKAAASFASENPQFLEMRFSLTTRSRNHGNRQRPQATLTIGRLRDNGLSNRIFKSYDDIVDHCCTPRTNSSISLSSTLYDFGYVQVQNRLFVATWLRA